MCPTTDNSEAISLAKWMDEQGAMKSGGSIRWCCIRIVLHCIGERVEQPMDAPVFILPMTTQHYVKSLVYLVGQLGMTFAWTEPIDRWERRKVHALCWSCSSAAAAAAHGSLIGPTMLAHWRELLVFESSSRALSQPDWGNWDDERAFYGISSMTGLIALRFALVWTDEFPQFS